MTNMTTVMPPIMPAIMPGPGPPAGTLPEADIRYGNPTTKQSAGMNDTTMTATMVTVRNHHACFIELSTGVPFMSCPGLIRDWPITEHHALNRPVRCRSSHRFTATCVCVSSRPSAGRSTMSFMDSDRPHVTQANALGSRCPRTSVP
jgi:hypothetical protein